MFEFVFGYVWVPVVLVLVLSVTRLLALAIALQDVPAGDREAVLRGLAECFRWWRARGPKA